MKNTILITGCGRSGSNYINNLLNKHNIKSVHENIYDNDYDVIVSWYLMFNRKDIPYYNKGINYKILPDIFNITNKILLVRHPLNVISSCYYNYTDNNYIKKCIPEIKPEDNKLLLLMKYWYYWNLEGLKTCKDYIKLENIEEDFYKLCKICNFKVDYFDDFNSLEKNHRKEYYNFTWQQLEDVSKDLTNKIKNLCLKLGYNLLNNIVDNIYVINLNRDLYKYKILKDKLLNLGIIHEQFQAIDGLELKDEFSFYKNKMKGKQLGYQPDKYGLYRHYGSYGILCSNLAVIKDAKKKGYNNIIIFEDDIYMIKNFNKEIEVIIGKINLNKFKFIWLGCNQSNWNNVSIKNNIYKPNNYSYGAYAIVINSSIFDELISNLEKRNAQSDYVLQLLAIKYLSESYIIYPNLFIPYVNTSSTGMNSRDENIFYKTRKIIKSNYDISYNYNKKYIFICGLHRSGTSSLTNLLGKSPKTSHHTNTNVIEDEGQFLQSIYKPAKFYGGPGVFGICKEYNYTEETDLLTKKNKEKIISEWNQYWDTTKEFLIEKTPANIIHTRFLQELVLESYFIVIIRHPFIVSIATMKWNKQSLYKYIEHWLYVHKIFYNDKEKIKNCLIIKYEELNINKFKKDINNFLKLDMRINNNEFDVLNDMQLSNKKYFENNKIPLDIINKYEKKINKYGYSFYYPYIIYNEK
jgi:GR25 family glycosyltransferase involved in LPS biosynthesis